LLRLKKLIARVIYAYDGREIMWQTGPPTSLVHPSIRVTVLWRASISTHTWSPNNCSAILLRLRN